jgi:hypothetical protein
LFAAAFFGYTWFWRYLETYQTGEDAKLGLSKPDAIADGVFDEYFADFDYERFYNAEGANRSEFESFEHYAAFINEKTEGKQLEYISVPSGSADIKKYAVLAGDAYLAEFTLKTQRDSADKPLWAFDGVRTVYDRVLEPFDIVVPENSKVFINGVPVSGDYVTNYEIPSFFEGPHTRYNIANLLFEPKITAFLPDGTETELLYDGAENAYSQPPKVITADVLSDSVLYVNGEKAGNEYIINGNVGDDAAARMKMRYVRYRFAGSFGRLTLLAESSLGRLFILSGSGGIYKQEIRYDEELRERFADFAGEAAKTYAMYMTNDSSLTAVRKYFESGTETYEAIRTSEVYWYTNHIGFNFENIEASEFYRHDAETFSCRVTLDHYVVRTQTDTRYFPLDVTFFIKVSNGNAMIVEMISNA